MTEQEIRALYATATAYDNRRPSEANITAWWQQAERNHWTFADALEAIHQHHAESTEYLMPAHITAIIKARKSQPRPVAETRQIEAAPPAAPERISAIVREVGTRLGWRGTDDGSDDDYRVALTTECPWCHAGPSRPCTVRVTRGVHQGEYRPMSHPHPSRVDIAKGAMA